MTLDVDSLDYSGALAVYRNAKAKLKHLREQSREAKELYVRATKRLALLRIQRGDRK